MVDTATREQVVAFVQTVFGTPDAPGSADHVEGHVAEWLWYLLTRERTEPDRGIALLEPPKFSVTEPGPDGFVVYEVAGTLLVFRLWELKKHVAANPVTDTVTTACRQLRLHGLRYLAQLTGAHADKPGPLGQLCAQLTDLWVEADERSGAGVGVTTATQPAVVDDSFGHVGLRLPRFRHPGQLEGLLCAVDGYAQLAQDVRGYLWSVL